MKAPNSTTGCLTIYVALMAQIVNELAWKMKVHWILSVPRGRTDQWIRV